LAIRYAKQIAAASFKDIDLSGFTVLSVALVDTTATCCRVPTHRSAARTS
jgi:hypothetical protein